MRHYFLQYLSGPVTPLRNPKQQELLHWPSEGLYLSNPMFRAGAFALSL